MRFGRVFRSGLQEAVGGVGISVWSSGILFWAILSFRINSGLGFRAMFGLVVHVFNLELGTA